MIFFNVNIGPKNDILTISCKRFFLETGVASGKSPHPRSSQAASTTSDWSDVLNLDSVPFTDWE